MILSVNQGDSLENGDEVVEGVVDIGDGD